MVLSAAACATALGADGGRRERTLGERGGMAPRGAARGGQKAGKRRHHESRIVLAVGVKEQALSLL